MKKSTLFLTLAILSTSSFAEKLGEVDTAFKLLGSNHKIVVESYADPMVNGVVCYVSRAKTGGITGTLGLASDTSDASIACRQVGKISFKGSVPQQDEVFTAKSSILFKTLRVVRMVDRANNSLVYLTYSDKLIDGSPKNSVTAVPVDVSTPIPMK